MQSIAWVQIDMEGFWLNGERIYLAESADFKDQLMLYYRALNMEYPKFHKMDELSRLAILGAEKLLHKQDKQYKQEAKEDIAILFANKFSSLSTDLKHSDSIKIETEYFPSPANFVYTLPNIAIGEVAIRHQIRGENTFWISDQPPIDKWVNYIDALFKEGQSKALVGWVEYTSPTLRKHLNIVNLQDKLTMALVSRKDRMDLDKELRVIFRT